MAPPTLQRLGPISGGVGGTLCLTHPSGPGATLVLCQGCSPTPRCSNRQPLPDLGAPPFLSVSSTQGGGTCMHWEWATSSAMGLTAPSATRFVPPKLPPPVGASDQPSFVEHPHPSRTTPKLLGPARGCWGRDMEGQWTHPIQSQAGPGASLPRRAHQASLRLLRNSPSFAEKINV